MVVMVGGWVGLRWFEGGDLGGGWRRVDVVLRYGDAGRGVSA